jgi:hypothetical protein
MKSMAKTTKQMLERFRKLSCLLQGLHRDDVTRLAIGRNLCRSSASAVAGGLR